MKNTDNKVDFIESLNTTGATFGFSKTKRHPSMKPFVVGTKKGFDTINVETTNIQLKEAAAAMYNFGSLGKTVVFLSSKPEFVNAIKDKAEKIGMPFVNHRWIGGTITNFSEIKTRLQKLEQMKKDKESGQFSLYTKKEQLIFDDQINDLKKHFGGISDIKKIPDALVIVDTTKESIAINESRGLNIPVIGIMGTNCNVMDATFPIVANDGSLSSVNYILGVLTDSYHEGRSTKAV